MSQLVKFLSFTGLICVATTSLAIPPKAMITHNGTNVESNAFIEGTIKSPHPTPANQTRIVPWINVKTLCNRYFNQPKPNNKCPAMIKMGTNTTNPVELGEVQIDSEGHITPTFLSAHGYTMQVIGLAEVQLSQP